MLEGRAAPDAPTRADVEEMKRMLLSRLLPGDELMDKVLRYESKFHRHLLQMLYMIMVMKGLIPAGTGRSYGAAALRPPAVSRRTDPPERPERPGS